MTPRIKVNSATGQIVVWEPDRTPAAPWFSIYAPDRRPGDAGQFLFTDEDVKDWKEWGPVRIEFATPAKGVLKGWEVLDRGVWQVVARATQEVDASGSPVTWLLFEEMPSAFLFDANETLTVRMSS